MLKKIGLSVLLCSVALGLAACGQQGSSDQTAATATTAGPATGSTTTTTTTPATGSTSSTTTTPASTNNGQ